MKVVSFVSLKGGTAKTTLARHCAVAAMQAGHRVTVVDCDQQGSLREWGEARGRAPEVIGETSTQRRYVEWRGRLEEQVIDEARRAPSIDDDRPTGRR